MTDAEPECGLLDGLWEWVDAEHKAGGQQPQAAVARYTDVRDAVERWRRAGRRTEDRGALAIQVVGKMQEWHQALAPGGAAAQSRTGAGGAMPFASSAQREADVQGDMAVAL